LTLLVISWNVDATRPDALAMGAANPDFVQEALQTVDFPDIIVFGLQEVIDLESRKMTAKNVLLGSKKEKDGGLSEKVSTGYKKWHDHFLHSVRLAMPTASYTVTHTESLVGLFSCVLVKKSNVANLQDVVATTVKRGLGGRYGNKVCCDEIVHSLKSSRTTTGRNCFSFRDRRLVHLHDQLSSCRRATSRSSAERGYCCHP
jgi:hypothetical protein